VDARALQSRIAPSWRHGPFDIADAQASVLTA
jgi:hypothetical protein